MSEQPGPERDRSGAEVAAGERLAPGRRHFLDALRRLRARPPTPPAPPLDLRPTTPFEQEILHQYQELRRDYEELKKRVDWLTLAIVGAALTLVLERVFG